MISDIDTTEVLSRLFEVEYRSPTGRLDQAMPFVQLKRANEDHALREMARQDMEHQQWLVQLLDERGGTPPPASFATDTTISHYNNVDSLLPGLIAAKKRLIESYSALSGQLARDVAAAAVVSKIMSRHQQHLAALEAMLAANKKS